MIESRRRCVTVAFFAFFSVVHGVRAQGPFVSASKDDWPTPIFAAKSAVLITGFPGLLRLAELLQHNSGYKVRLEGHTDHHEVEGTEAADELGLRRAQAVRDFLIKYGAAVAQIQVVTEGWKRPSVPEDTEEGRSINRRVQIILTDA